MHDGLAGLIGLGAGCDAQESALTAVEDSEALRAQRGQSTLTTDESLDRSIGEHDRFVARLGRGRPLGQHDAGVDERDALATEAIGGRAKSA